MCIRDRLSAGLWKNRSCYSSNPGPFPGTGPDHGNILLKSANPFFCLLYTSLGEAPRFRANINKLGHNSDTGIRKFSKALALSLIHICL